MDKRKKYHLLIDVETTNGFKAPLVYDVGYAIIDRKGVIYEKHSFLVKQVFDNSRLMASAYYKEKIPSYKIELEKGLHKLKTWQTITEHIRKTAKKWNVKKVGAYNLAFDKNAMASTNDFLGDGRKILKGVKIEEEVCIWALACQTIFLQKSFQQTAVEQKWLTEAGNMKTSAEIAYRYITGKHDFIEEHKGLADVKIEAEIMAHCFKQHKKITKGIIPHPWRIPNSR